MKSTYLEGAITCFLAATAMQVGNPQPTRDVSRIILTTYCIAAVLLFNFIVS